MLFDVIHEVQGDGGALLQGVAHRAGAVNGPVHALAEHGELLGAQGGKVGDDLDVKSLVALLIVVLDGGADDVGVEVRAQGLDAGFSVFYRPAQTLGSPRLGSG